MENDKMLEFLKIECLDILDLDFLTLDTLVKHSRNQAFKIKDSIFRFSRYPRLHL